ncbi:MAG TPA: hypothetical protein PLS15_12645 [Fimbriimonadaceae bacterium]|nr:hypothetical protein [Fimbriimonadaceae bacterium]HRE92707.1 hypothetical protein [Fimbriimonadaceae bacterium]
MKNLIIATSLLALGTLGAVSPALVHEAECPYCKLKLVQNTNAKDNEVVVRFGNKKIEYRCIYCVFADQKKLTGDLIVYAPSEAAGKPVLVRRTGGNWTAPEGTVFLNAFRRHQECAGLSRTFSSKSAFDRYVAANNVANAKALTLKEMLAEVAKAN